MAEKILVMKFGGTSVGSPQALLHATRIISNAKDEWPHVIVVVSALSGVTNLLLDCAEKASAGGTGIIKTTANELRERHNNIITELIDNETVQKKTRAEIDMLVVQFENLCNAIRVLGEYTPRAMDAIVSLGERFSVRLVSAILVSKGLAALHIDADKFLVTDESFQNAHPDMAATREKTSKVIIPALEADNIPVITGFIGATKDGVTTTLGRGGSDYSAALIASALEASEVWIWTDVNGVMTADPRLVPQARTIDVLSYREVAELAYFGAKVLHPKTIRPVIEAGIGLRVCNTFSPDQPGTRIIPDADNNDHGIIKAVTIIGQQQLITIEGRGMLGVPGVAARTFGAVAATGTSVTLISQASSEQSICFTTPVHSTTSAITSLKAAFSEELDRRDIDRIWATDEVSIVTVVGAGMRNTPGIAGRVFSALGSEGVNVIAIAQGSSEVSISLIVDSNDAKPALKSLHKLVNF
jgi:aspartate kinase